MNWEEKLEAFKGLVGEFNVSLNMRAPGNWYVHTSFLEIGGNGLLSSVAGTGRTPEMAAENHWREYVTDLPLDHYLVVQLPGRGRRHFRWQGYMWRELEK
jgi:hypothetical protein